MIESDTATEAEAWRTEMSQLEGELEVEEPAESPATEDEPGQTDAPPAGEPGPADSEGEAPAEAGDAGDQPQEPAAAEGEQQPEAAAPQDGPPTPEPQQPQIEPVRVRADGTDLDAPGVIRSQGHIVMPEATWYQRIVPRLVADRRNLKQQGIDEGRKLAEAEIAQHPEMARAKAVLTAFEQLEGMDVDGVVQWALDFKQNLPVLKERAEKAALQAQLERQQSTTQKQQDRQTEQERTEAKQQSLMGHVQRALTQAGLQLDPNPIYQRLWRSRADLYVTADRDYPEYGVREGDEIIRNELFYAEIQDAAQRAQYAAANKPKEQQKTQARNAAALGKTPAKKPAPTATSQTEPAAAKPKDKEPESLDEWREMMRS